MIMVHFEMGKHGMSEHTKAPWRVSRGGNFIDAPVGGGTLQEVAWCGDCEHGDRNANAKHIVHCVNNHERLTQALRQSGCPSAKISESFGILSVSECCELFQICDCGNSEVLAGLDATK